MKPRTLLVVYILYFLAKHVFLDSSKELGFLVQVLDVGQGDAILVTTANNHTILIDGGAGFEVDSYLPFPECHLDVVVLTHPHSDHLEGLYRVLQRCSVDVVLFNDISYESSLYTSWQELMKNFVVRTASVEDRFSMDGVDFYVLWPPQGDLSRFLDNVNNVSIVLFMDYGKFEAVFTGDAEKEVLDRVDISPVWGLIDGNFDLYKVPHHGARNALSTRFIQMLDPANFVISVGKDNHFGHPHSEVLEFLSGRRIYRTDLDGTVKFR